MEQLKTILDFSQPLNVPILDQAVKAFYAGNMGLQSILVKFQQHPKAWTRVETILSKSGSPHCKMLALKILEETVQYKWGLMPLQQRTGVRKYVVGLIVKLSSSKESLRTNRVFLRRLNLILVQIVKHEWPKNWPEFIPDLVKSSQAGPSLCANNMNILKLLSEEIFDFSQDQMTQAKVREMKVSLNSQFKLIFKLCEATLTKSQDVLVLTATLQTLLRFLRWIPAGYIFETSLLGTLAMKFYPAKQFRNITLQCLGEIGSIDTKGKYRDQVLNLFKAVVHHTTKIFGPNTNLAQVYERGNASECNYIRYLSLFLTGMIKRHLKTIESGGQESVAALFRGLAALLMISRVNDIVIWKICLECWNMLVEDLFQSQKHAPMGGGGLMLGGSRKMSPRVQRYADILSRLRYVMIERMPKPEEVLLVKDENGQVVRETLKDTDSITLYNSMRDGLIFLTHLDEVDMQRTMIKKLHAQVEGPQWSHESLNTLCWSVGSISGALDEDRERKFLVQVIKDLLTMCDQKSGKNNKAVIAGNIMYVVGQYPRFLKEHWQFLKTVVEKLFEFMHEVHPGVQDMSCDTFLKIVKKCKRKFVLSQDAGQRPYIRDIIIMLPQTISKLKQNQIHTFYEAVAVIVQSEERPDVIQELTMGLMKLPNQTWSAIITRANRNISELFDLQTIKVVVSVLKTNNRVAGALGHMFSIQLGRIYLEMLQVYKAYSGRVSKEIERVGERATQTVVVRNMRAVKKEVLKLIQTFVKKSKQAQFQMIFQKLLPKLIDPVLDDYKRGVPQARDGEVLMLIAELVRRLGPMMRPVLGRVFDATFASTLAMIRVDFVKFPDVRRSFFNMIRAINQRCFPTLMALNPQQFKLVMDSILWSIKHLDKTVAEIGLHTLAELMANVQKSQAATKFYKTYYMRLLKDIMGVLSDTFHKPGFRMHTLILQRLFHVVSSGTVTQPLWATGQGNFQNNVQFVQTALLRLIGASFKNVTRAQAQHFAIGAFKFLSNTDEFKRHIRDFLVQLKEFRSDKEGLYDEEKQKAMADRKAREHARAAAVPGLLKQQ